RELAEPLALDDGRIDALRDLGESLTYNAYGDAVSDLIIPPAALFHVMRPYTDPFRFIRTEPIVRRLSEARRDDLAMASEVDPALTFDHATLYLLPDAAWSRRVIGVFANELANRFPDLAHAVVAPNA